MRVAVVYAPRSGNTELLAREVAGRLDAEATPADEISPMDVEASDLLVVGTPAHGADDAVEKLLRRLPDHALQGLQAATFDTLVAGAHFLGSRGSARVARALRGKGAAVVEGPESFLVAADGPLEEGEVERARAWAVALRERAAELARRRSVDTEPAEARPSILPRAGTHPYPAAPITIRWEGTATRDPEPDEDGKQPAER